MQINEPVDRSLNVATQRAARKALTKLSELDGKTIVVELASPDQIAKLNLQWRKINEPTDILSLATLESVHGQQKILTNQGKLSFSLQKSTDKIKLPPILGQLIVCLDVIKDNAAASGQSPETELEWVIEHGVYHLAGFHHDDD